MHCTLSICCSVSLPVCLSDASHLLENRTRATFKRSAEITHVRSNRHDSLQVKRLRVRVIEGGNVKIIFGTSS